jgi:hypothetical protein
VQKARAVTPILVRRGTTQQFGWPILRAGQRVSLDGWTVRALVRPALDSDVVLHEFSTTEGNARTENGYVLIESTVDSETWPWDAGIYDVHATDPDGNVLHVAEGPIKVRKSVTR